jgi:AraC-like DNA-binding protein
MSNEIFFKDQELPFVECRYSSGSKREYKAHMHSSFSIGALDSGQVEYNVVDQRSTLSVGSLALINPELLHSCNAITEEGRSYYMLYLDVAWCLQVQQSLWHVDAFVPVQQIRLDDSVLYRQYCQTMQLVMGRETHLMAKEQLLVDVVSIVFKECCNKQVEVKNSKDPDIEELKKLLSLSLKEDLTLEFLAGEFNVNAYTFLRRFKKATGITPHAYRMNCRIEQAKRYLQQGMDIAETALECGFFDQSHLHRHFKAMTTVTPKEYRVNFVQ